MNLMVANTESEPLPLLRTLILLHARQQAWVESQCAPTFVSTSHLPPIEIPLHQMVCPQRKARNRLRRARASYRTRLWKETRLPWTSLRSPLLRRRTRPRRIARPTLSLSHSRTSSQATLVPDIDSRDLLRAFADVLEDRMKTCLRLEELISDHEKVGSSRSVDPLHPIT